MIVSDDLTHTYRALWLAIVVSILMFSPLAWAQAPNAAERPTFSKINLRLLNQSLTVEVARTPPQREFGLMFHPPLQDNEGMLFVFPNDDIHCFWMKNTPASLTIVFIDADGGINDIKAMQAETENVHCPKSPVRYALELAQGWFDRAGVISHAPLMWPTHRYHRVHFKPKPQPALD